MLTNKIAQLSQFGLVILHGVGEVHEVVQIHRVVFRLTEHNGHSHWLIWKRNKQVDCLWLNYLH